jgi:hypothetical protein
MTTAYDTAAPPGWREEARRDREARARLDIERDAARSAARIAELEAAEARRATRAENSRKASAEAAAARAARLAALGDWVNRHVIDLLFVPVIGVPAALAWTAMASYGAHLYGTPGRALPAFSEGAMWAFAAAATITRHRHPDRPVWHLRLGTLAGALFGAVLNYAHGLTLGGPVTGVVMALVSVAGVTAHQITTAGPRHARRRTRADRDAERIARLAARRVRQARAEAVKAAAVELGTDGAARLVYATDAPEGTVPAPAPDTGTDTPGRTPGRTPRTSAGRTSRTDTASRVASLRRQYPDMPAAEIARRLGVTDRTVRRHLAATATIQPTTGDTPDAR